MTVKEASAAIGRPLVKVYLDGCDYVEPKGLASGGRIAPIRFVLGKDRRIAGAEIFYGPWATDAGVRVGDPEQKFKDAYRARLRDGKLVSSDPKDRDFTMEVANVDSAGRIQRIRAWRNDVDCG
jgi:hypothetical protein